MDCKQNKGHGYLWLWLTVHCVLLDNAWSSFHLIFSAANVFGQEPTSLLHPGAIKDLSNHRRDNLQKMALPGAATN
ncbi:hypothetical protein BDP27DRAFT_1333331 [Rhodocollybia butyracea]|uniref:Secreted protein n=1 Tax=Rhodocollybia butyracea TaxID=206335 RepID=A0A9P5PL94_9AGAR|nr:hypothetical protein BDP27DRAFT_1333331 [Rhodocollybia butyracea]